jgi:hypothetical protein
VTAGPGEPRPLGQLDARMPASYAEPVPAGLRVLVEFFAALAARDPPTTGSPPRRTRSRWRPTGTGGGGVPAAWVMMYHDRSNDDLS